MVGTDVAGVLHSHASCDEGAPVAAVGDEGGVGEDVDHEGFEGAGAGDGTETGFEGGRTGPVAGERGDDEVEGLVGGGGGVREGEEDFAGFEKGAGPAVDNEEGDGGGGGGAVVCVMDKLGAVVGYVYLDHKLVELFVDLGLEERSVFDYDWRLRGD